MDLIATLLDAISLARAGAWAEAEALLHQVLALAPEQPNALYLAGQCALGQGRPMEALTWLRRSLALRPSHLEGRVALARAALAADLPGEALSVLDGVVAPAADCLRGTALSALGRPADAVLALRAAVLADPADAEAALNLGNALAELDDPAAEDQLRLAVSLAPELAAAWGSLGHFLTRRGALGEAVAATDQAIALAPGLAAAHWNRATALLLGGDLPAGFEGYEWRKRRFPESFTRLPAPEWEGGPADGQTILVVAEQGLGDTIQFARYLPMLAARGLRVRLQCAAGLAGLLGRSLGVETFPPGARPAHDVWIDQMSLPRAFGTSLPTVPSSASYLQADPERAAAWGHVLPAGVRVGLAWAGNALHSNDRRRSLPAASLLPVMALPGVRFVSLQAGPRAGELPGVLDLTDRLTNWEETAALVAGLDLVITVDTAVAHLAGALGVPAWVLLPHAPDWRWMLARDDTPWYAAMRLFRQDRPGDWAGVVRRVADELAATALAKARPRYSIAMPPLTCSVAPVTQPASSEAR